MDKSLLKSLKYMIVMINIFLTITMMGFLLSFGVGIGNYINTRNTINTYTTNQQIYK